MQTKHCQHCDRVIPVNAVFCQFCGAKQYMVNDQAFNPTANGQQPSRIQRDREDGYSKRPPMNNTYPRPYMDRAILTHTDWAMLGVNVISAVLQLLFSAQTMLMPLSKSDGEFIACIVVAVAGVAISGLDAYECYKNRLPMWASLLGVAGNILGIGIAALLYTDVMTIVGTIILGVSFWLIYYQIHHLYGK